MGADYRIMTLTNDELHALDDGQEWWRNGDTVELEGYLQSDSIFAGMLQLTVNGYTHDNWISWDDLAEQFPIIHARLIAS